MTYRCSACGETFENEWSDEEARNECRDNFGVDPEGLSGGSTMVCDDCYKAIMKVADKERWPRNL